MKNKLIYLFLVVFVSILFYGCNNKEINENGEASSVGVIGGENKDTINLSDTKSMNPDEIINFNSLINSNDVIFDKNLDRNNFIKEEENCINSFGTYETKDGNIAIAKSVISVNKVKQNNYEIKYLVYGSTNEILEKKLNKQIGLSEYELINVSNIYIKTVSGSHSLVSLNNLELNK